MGTSSISFSIVSVLVIFSVLWKPSYSDDFKSGCKGSPSGPTFANGHKYNYGVDGTVSIYVTGAEKQETSVKIVGQVSVSALGNCDYVLKVQNLVISGPDGKKYGKPPGVEKPVKFTLEDGRVGPQIQAEEGDTRRSLNIKRAIISLLQTEQKPSTQVDVFGACPTDVSSSKEGSALLVHRSRDLSRCAHREQGKNGLLTAVYNPTSEIKNTLVLQSTLNVESKVNNGVPEKVSATEEYLYKPFSVGENGARAKVETKLTLTGKTGGADNGQFKEVRTIIFENPHGTKSEASNYQSALNAVKDTAKTLSTEASSQSASSFAGLVKILRPTNKEDLIKVFNQVKGNSLEKRVFLDALLRAGTGFSIDASIQFLKNKELSPVEQQLVFLSLGNARHVNDDALKSATSLLDQPNLPKEIYLGVGALAGSYCRDHFCHDSKSEGIVALSQKLGSKLQNCKPKSKLEEDNVVAILKGIRNIRHLEDSLINKIVDCATKSVKARVKVAALEAFHADPCAAKIKKTGLDLMKNRQLDSEIRIKAYLSVIECPCGKSANEIKNLLESEPVHQVGRFITSSLRFIRSSANPDKQLARQHYGLIRTPNKFNVDDRKYSFYREASFNVDSAGVGGDVEQTVIYSQNSFVPRSASLNLTAELFGHNINILEIGGRQGNLDRVIEHFLGPKSFLRTDSPQTIYDNLVKRFEDAKHKVDGLRSRRSVKTEIDAFDKKVKAESAPWNNELDLDIYVKLFGTDAVFLSLGDDKGFNFDKFLDQVFTNVHDGMDKIKHFHQEVRGHLLFLDAELAYPTSTGLPLKLDLTGAATARLEVATNVDIQQILRSPETAKLDIKLVPSTDIEVSGVFAVDADAVLTGLKVSSNLHSSTGGHLIAKVLEGGRGIDLLFDLPIEKQEILTASNDLVYIIVEKGQKSKSVAIKIDSDRKEYSGCFDQLSDLLGLTLCGEISVPFSVSGPEAQGSISKFLARYPLTGPSKVKLVLEKNDLRGYHIKGVLRDSNPERQSFELLFEAEGSRNRRTQLAGELVNTNEEKTVKISLESPIKSASAQISLFRKPNEYAVLVKANLDREEYFARAGFSVQGNDRRTVYKPVVEYQIPNSQGKQSLQIEGQIIKEIDGATTKINIDGSKIYLPGSKEVITLNGHYKEEPTNIEIEIKAKKGEHNVILSGSAVGSDVKLEFQNSLNPYINFRVNGHFETGETIHNDIDIYYGPDLHNSQNRISLNQLLKYRKGTAEDFSLITKNKVEINAIPFKVKVEAEIDPKKIDVELEGQYMDKKAKFDLKARTHIKNPGDYNIKVEASADKQGIEAFAKRDIVSADKSNLENYIQIKNFGKYELSGVVLHKTKPNDMNVGAIGHLKVSGGSKSEDIKFDIGIIENTNLYSSHAKVSGSNGDLIDYLLKINRGSNPSGQLKLVLKDTIAANGQFTVTDSDGKGNGMIIVDFKKIQRKIKGEVKFVVKNPTYNADIDLFLNFEKDKNDKIRFSTKTRKTDTLTDSKNVFDYAGKKTQVNVYQSGPIELEGKMNAVIDVILPTERLLSFKVNRELNKNNDVYNGQAELVLLDDDKRGGGASSITYKAKVINTNFEKENINYEGQFEIKLNNGKQLQNVFTVKHTPEGDRSKLDFKTDVTGNLIPKPSSLSATIDYTNDESIDGMQNYRVKGSYGSEIGFELVGKEEHKLSEKGEKKYHEDQTLTIRLPFENAHDIKVVSNVLFTQPDNDEIIAEYTVIESLQVNSDLYKVEASGRLGVKNGFGKVKILVPHVDPVSLDTSYSGNFEGEKKNANVEVKTVYGKSKAASIAVAVETVHQENNVIIRITAPEKVLGIGEKLDIKWHAKNPAPDSYNTNFVVDADGRQYYKAESQFVYSKANPMFDIKFSSPESAKPGRIYVKGNSLGSTHAKAEVKVENFREINFDVTSELNVQKDNMAVKVNADSNTLGLKHFVLDISSKDSGSGKRLEFHATNDKNNILSGSTSFISKQEGPKTIIEGSGSVKVKNEQKSANFKYIRTVLTEGNEQGIETFLKLAIGESSYVAESRVTNLEYKTSYVYCEEKKQCAHAEFNSKINVQKTGLVQHVLNAGLDLRKLGFAPEFGLEAFSDISQSKLPQYKLDLHISKEDKKYHLHIYSQPDYGKFPAGITITLPQRILAWESLVTYPTDKSLPFPVKGKVEFYMDKNKPNQKSAARFLIDVTGDSKQHRAVAEIGFSHPKLGQEALVKFQGSLQNPSENNYKVESAASISHPTLGAVRESKVLLEVNPMHLKFLVNTPVVQVIDLEGTITLKDNLQQGEIKFSVLQGKPVQIRAVARDFQYYEFTTGYSDDSERKISIIGHLEPEKRVDISADIIVPGEKKNIIHGALYLQDNLVKSDYGISKENFNYFVNALKKDLDTLETRVKNLGETASNDLKNTLKRVEPTLKQLDQAYKDDFEKLFKEVSNDKVLKEISEELSKIYGFVAKIIVDVVDITKPVVDQISEVIRVTSQKVLELFEKQIEPQLKEFYANVAAVVKQYLDSLIDVVAHYAALVTDFFEKHKPELEELTNTIAEIFKDLTRLVVAQLKEFRAKASELLSDIMKQINELPIIDVIRQKWQELAVPEQFLSFWSGIHGTIRQLFPTEESRTFADHLYNYIQKKLRQQKVDDVAELRVVYEKFALALASVVQFVRDQLNQFGVTNVVNVNSVPFLSGPGQLSLPSFGGTASFSLISQLLKGDFPDPLSLIRAYKPRSINPLDEVPAKLHAVVVNGQHIFTFDGRHLTFPGNCRYILAHDFVDRNFTLVLQLQSGQPKALILEDKSGVTIELKQNGQVSLNGADHGYPVIEKDVFAFRQTNGRIGLGSVYGLMVFCTSKLEVCYFDVSGFYSGKLRGLLGDGNNEPYDDFTLPDGKITTSESDFGNAYRLATSCPIVKSPEHSAHQHHASLPAACEQVFGGSSPLRPISLLLDMSPFRQACIHAVTADSANALHQACDLGRGYAALALTGLLPAALPAVCLRCNDADTPKEVGDTYELKLPAKQADIVVTVETTKSNEKNFKNLVVPLVAQLVNSLKSKHIDDIKVYLVGITSQYPYPIVYDTDIKLTTPKVQFTDESRYQYLRRVKTNFGKIDQWEDMVAGWIDDIRISLGLTNVIAGYHSVLDLPLRPGAVKHTINVVGEHCRTQNFLVEVLRSITYNTIFKENAYTHSLVALTPNLKVGSGKNAAQIVGFSDEAVLMLGDKKQAKDSHALRSSLKFTKDSCIDFVRSTQGFVFSGSNFHNLNPSQQKQFVQTAANAITQKMLAENLVQECFCKYVDPFRVRSICINKERKEQARRRK